MRRASLTLITLVTGLVAAALLAPAVLPAVLCAGTVGILATVRAVRTGDPWQPADAVTAVRLVLLMAGGGMVAGHQWQVGWSTIPGAHVAIPWPVVAVVGVALAADLLDGLIARRTVSTRAGARFDESSDAAAVLLLSVAAVPVVGAWVLLLGLAHYVFAVAARFRPAWRADLSPSLGRKAVAAVQGPLLLLAGSPLCTGPQAPLGAGWAIMFAALAAGLLLWSFGHAIWHLERQWPGAAAAAPKSR